MTFAVLLSEAALDDLFHIRQWVRDQAGAAVAEAYFVRISARLGSLQDFPDRGTPRDDLQPGVRTVPFERRLMILYRVEGDTVRVLRVVRGARELGELLG